MNPTPPKILVVAVAVLAALVAGVLAYRFYSDAQRSRTDAVAHAQAEPTGLPASPAARPETPPPAAASRPATPADPIIAKARAFLGTEAALNAVRSVHFIGTMENQLMTPEGPKPVKTSLEIIFQKPYQQRITLTSPTLIETTALDDYEGWQRQLDPTKPKQWRLTVLAPAVVKNLRANTWENLCFYRGIEDRGGRADFVGPASVDGVATNKVAFIHERGIVFYRHFDQTTGRLVLTETDQGGRIKEDGEIIVNGVRFPQKVTTIVKGRNAQGQMIEGTNVITFDKITLNETFPESMFETPPLPSP